ncbi:hypothetical protein QBC47DRAFT_404006 [Echria macrotheca]|uniref:DUF423-domain-containing protein n=1 Tax=Echria macrotheca TaxID=438768 RepID=A0AAJ0BAV9_9PEZI|nr:hypothetical protein QBC47DRAFT_404006 [Echria macrotheca]
MSTGQDTRNPDEQTPLIVSPENRSAKRFAMSGETFWKVGAIYGATAVALGAFGAHGLKKVIADPAKIGNWSTAAQYQLIHSVALLIARDNTLAASFFTAGMTLFSGSIYALTLDTARFRFLGPVTPLGGLFMIAGWTTLAFSKSGDAARWRF